MRPLWLLLVLLAACRPASDPPTLGQRHADTLRAATADSATARLVTLGAAATETVFLLGAGDAVVGVDATSAALAADRPAVAVFPLVDADSVLALRPTLVFAGDGARPRSELDRLARAGAKVVFLPGGASVDSIAAMVWQVAGALGRADDGQRLVDTLRHHALRAAADTLGPWTAYVDLDADGRAAVAGDSTAGDLCLRLAGARNAARGTAGEIAGRVRWAAAPTSVVATARTVARLGGPEGLNAALRRAGAGRVPLVVLGDADAVLGPRLPAAMHRLRTRLVERR